MLDNNHNGNTVITIFSVLATWIFSIASLLTKENVTFIIATIVSLLAIINFIFSIKNHKLKIKEMKEKKKNNQNPKPPKRGGSAL